MAGLWPAGWSPVATSGRTGPIILTLGLPQPLQRQADALRRQREPRAAGRAPAHVSLFRHLPGLQIEPLLHDLRTLAAAGAPAFGLDPPQRWDRLWVARLRSNPLDDLRADLAARWHGLLSPGDLAAPRLHLSLGTGSEPPPPLPPGPHAATALLLWQHGGTGPDRTGPDKQDGAFWTPLVAVAFRR